MDIRKFYRSIVPFNLRFRLATIRSALRLAVPPEEVQVNMDRWFVERGDDALLDFALLPESVAVDVGAYHGNWTSDIFGRFQCRVVSIEPVPDYAAILRKRFANNPKIEVQEMAIGAKKRRETVSRLGVASSTMRRGSSAIEVQVEDIRDWFEALAVPRVDVIAINCEGGEYEILPRIAELGLTTRFVNILVQFHLLGNDAHKERDKIRRHLQKTHDQIFNYPFVWELWRLRPTEQ